MRDVIVAVLSLIGAWAVIMFAIYLAGDCAVIVTRELTIKTFLLAAIINTLLWTV